MNLNHWQHSILEFVVKFHIQTKLFTGSSRNKGTSQNSKTNMKIFYHSRNYLNISFRAENKHRRYMDEVGIQLLCGCLPHKHKALVLIPNTKGEREKEMSREEDREEAGREGVKLPMFTMTDLAYAQDLNLTEGHTYWICVSPAPPLPPPPLHPTLDWPVASLPPLKSSASRRKFRVSLWTDPTGKVRPQTHAIWTSKEWFPRSLSHLPMSCSESICWEWPLPGLSHLILWPFPRSSPSL